MGIFDIFFGSSKELSKTNVERITKFHVGSYTKTIPQEIYDLLWFTSSENLHKIEFSLSEKSAGAVDTEPSAINLKLPISSKKPEPTGYYPSYIEFSPEQRNAYINWLCNITNVQDIGYPFLFLYGLERHIYEGNKVTESVNQITKLHKIINNNSFNYYSANAIIWAAHKYKNTDYLNGLDLDKLPAESQILSKLKKFNCLTAKDIITLSKPLGMTNQRYIKNEPELFEVELTKQLVKHYGDDVFRIPEISSSIPTSELILSNYSLPEQSRIINIPNLLLSKEVGISLLGDIMITHENVKSKLREIRKNKKRIE